jgi:hypothetical protein
MAEPGGGNEDRHHRRRHRWPLSRPAAVEAGFDVHVYEQAAAIGEIGAGIQISPNASRLLVRLGLEPAMDKVSVRTARRAPAPLG